MLLLATSDFQDSDKGINTHGLNFTCRQFGLSVLAFTIYDILKKSENATPELFDIYIQNYANQESVSLCSNTG